LRTRCPQCGKLYEVLASLNAGAENSYIICTSCGWEFDSKKAQLNFRDLPPVLSGKNTDQWARYNGAIDQETIDQEEFDYQKMGYQKTDSPEIYNPEIYKPEFNSNLAVKPKIIDSSVCPFCKQPVTDWNSECKSCLRYPSKMPSQKVNNGRVYSRGERRDSPTGDLAGPPSHSQSHSLGHSSVDPLEVRLAAEWQNVLENFTDSSAHQAFVGLCTKLNKIEFGEQKYRRLRQIIGEDPEVDKRIRIFEVLRFESSSILESPAWNLRLAKARSRWILVISVIAILLLLGLVV
jgi:transcription elongation factor Elf1